MIPLIFLPQTLTLAMSKHDRVFLPLYLTHTHTYTHTHQHSLQLRIWCHYHSHHSTKKNWNKLYSVRALIKSLHIHTFVTLNEDEGRLLQFVLTL